MPLPHVSSEGGPLLIADYEALKPWRGAFHDSGDYERACDALGDSTLIQFQAGDHQAIVWDIGGPGTAWLVQVSPTHISFVRIWPDEAWSDEAIEQAIITAATEHFGSQELALLTILSGYLLGLWAPEDLTCSSPPSGESGVLDDLSIGDGGAYLKVPAGCYSVTACEWQAPNFDVTKIDLRLVS